MRTLAIALCLLLSACTANQVLESIPVVGNVCEAADRTLIDEKVVFAAETLYNIPAQAYVTADKNGRLTPALKAQTKPILIKMDDLRRAISAARGTVNCDFKQMQELQVQVIKLLPR